MEGTKSAVPRPVTGHGRAFNCYLPRHGLSNTLFLPCGPRDGANRPGLIIYISHDIRYKKMIATRYSLSKLGKVKHISKGIDKMNRIEQK